MARFHYLFNTFQVKNLSLKNRVVMPPMCQYQAVDGMPTDWHHVHYVSRAIGGVSLIIVEMTNVAPNGRISPNCLGLWNDEQRDAWKKIVDAVHAQGAKIAIQIGHAGRKALATDEVVSSCGVAYDGAVEAGNDWHYKTPKELTTEETKEIVQLFQDSVKRAVEAGFDGIELHGAHGYLIHQFASPKTNQRTDEYGKNRALFGEQIIKQAKLVMPEGMPLWIRISAQEYSKNGFSLEYGCELAKKYAEAGVDMIHVSGGGDGVLDPNHTPVFKAGYQVYLAKAVKKATGLPVIAVGMLEDPALADYVLGENQADLVAIGRGLLREPHWVLNVQYQQNKADSLPMQFVPSSYKGSYGA